ncbi:hypothetical protein EPA93_15455 [Ktedonosporobacter rubrisoli]|uniref:Uncharacterized protein n=1 Tax=Ktedonosporobacter rubrisoli TaxID=2509675 RepID=A0A4V0YYT2_KTERU|nr:hypothetical protein [Ktedonosporobacter rubrisoli]QBD77311.1 hypothetical protein EPA93_15455 [Ktedonosporobacter rubrisoli]
MSDLIPPGNCLGTYYHRYSFPHPTFQEYLTARYIAAQPNPDYIDMVMAHLHEDWWQEVHLLTIAHLGSGKSGNACDSDTQLWWSPPGITGESVEPTPVITRTRGRGKTFSGCLLHRRNNRSLRFMHQLS